MKFIVTLLFLFAFWSVANSCKPSSNDTITGGGRGGTSVIYVTGEAHGYLLDTCIMYIKYNTLNAPANGVYDDSAVCTLVNGTPVASFDSLTVGNYYLLAIGYHGAYSPPNVKGGKAIIIPKTGVAVSDTIPAAPYLP